MKKIINFFVIILIFYIFFFQIAVFEINKFIQIGTIIITFLFLVYCLIKNLKLNEIFPLELKFLVLFALFTFFTGIFTAPNFDLFINMEILIISSTITGIIVAFLVKETKDKNLILKIILLSSFLLSLYFIINGDTTVYGRIILIDSVNVNEIANIINIGFISLLFLWIDANRRQKFLYTIVGIIQIYAIVISGTRKSFLGVCILIGVFIMLNIFKRKKRDKKEMLIIMTFFLLGIIFIMYVTPCFFNNSLIGSRFQGLDPGDEVRINLYFDAFTLFSTNPFIGVGVRGFEFYFGMYSHSNYAELASCTGIFGTILYLSIFLIQWKKLSKLLKYSEDKIVQKKIQVLRSSIVLMLFLGVTMVLFYSMYSYLIIGYISGYIGKLSKTMK